MLRLVEAELTAAREPNLRDGPPARFFDLRADDATVGERGHLCREVVAHEEELGSRCRSWMHGSLGRRQGEDQPAATGVDRRKPEYLREEGPIGIGIVAGDDDMGTEDHAPLCPILIRAAAADGGPAAFGGGLWARIPRGPLTVL